MSIIIESNGNEISHVTDQTSANVIYNGSLISSMTSPIKKTLLCADKYMASDVVVGTKTLKCSDKIMPNNIDIYAIPRRTFTGFTDVYGDGSYLIISYRGIPLKNLFEGGRLDMVDYLGYCEYTSRTIASVVNIKIQSDTSSDILTEEDLAYIHTGLTSLTTLELDCEIEDGAIPDYAFQNDTHLQHLTLGSGVTVIGKESFEGSALIDISASDVTEVGYAAFMNSTSLLKAVMPKLYAFNYTNSGTSHCTMTFYGCSNFKVLEMSYPKKMWLDNNNNMRRTLTGCSNFKMVVSHVENTSTDIEYRPEFWAGLFRDDSNPPTYYILMSSSTSNPAGVNFVAKSSGRSEASKICDTGTSLPADYEYGDTLPASVLWSCQFGTGTGLSSIGYGDYAYTEDTSS